MQKAIATAVHKPVFLRNRKNNFHGISNNRVYVYKQEDNVSERIDMKKIIYLSCGLITVICTNTFANTVYYQETTPAQMVYCVSNPASTCSNMFPGTNMQGKYDTVTHVFYLEPSGAPQTPALTFSNNQLHEGFCYQRVAKNDYAQQPWSYCQGSSKSYRSILMIGRYSQMTQKIYTTMNISGNILKKNKAYKTIRASFAGSVYSPIS